MAIAKGVSLGPYEILSRIGAGGMGEVWRARDKRIGRDVAIKVLPEMFVPGEDLVKRFEQEARAAGALNHPGLVTIYDVGAIDHAHYIVMELLEGQTLRDVLSTALPVRKAIDYATQIATALAVAHEKGIIHRDLKPENLFVTSEGRVKILDFGLAKLAAEASGPDGLQRTGAHLTASGFVVGTPGYMSPEQVRAQPIDHRTDIFSLGTVMYEMLSGRSVFECESAVETMHAVLNIEPAPLTTLNAEVPPALDTIVRHCMEKNPRDRNQSARDLAFQLRMVGEGRSGSITDVRPAPAPPKRLRRRAAVAAALALFAATAAALAIYQVRNGSEPRAIPRSYKQLTFADGLELFPALAPDGKSFAYVSTHSGNRDIYVQRVDGRSAINLTSDSPDDDSEPAFSPDGSQIAFRSERDGGGIYVMGVTGESVRRLTDFGHNPSWAPDSTRIVVSTAPVELRPHLRPGNGELWIIDTRTQVKKAIVQARTGGPDFGRDSDAVQPNWSADGKYIAFWGLSTWSGQRDLWTIEAEAPQPKQTVVRVTSDAAVDWSPVWSPDGQYLYFGSDRDGTMNLWRVPMEGGKPAGAPQTLSLPAAFSGNFSFSQKGELAYVAVARSFRLLAVPFDAAAGKVGEPRTVQGGSEEIISFAPSPDQRLIAYTTAGAQEDLFIANTDGTRLRQLTNDAAKDRVPAWSPDGKTIYFFSNRDGTYHVWSIRADGSGLTKITDEADLKRTGARNIFTPDVSPDGRTLVVQTDRSDALIHLDRPAGQRLEPIPDSFELPKFSRDGRYLVGVVVRHNRAGLHQLAATGSRGGIGIYSLATGKSETVFDRGMAPRPLPGGRNVAFFERDGVGIIDLTSRRVSKVPFPPLPGVELDSASVWPAFSSDGATLYVRQAQEQGDIWLVRLQQP